MPKKHPPKPAAKPTPKPSRKVAAKPANMAVNPSVKPTPQPAKKSATAAPKRKPVAATKAAPKSNKGKTIAKPKPLRTPKPEPLPMAADGSGGLDPEVTALKAGRPSLYQPEFVEVAHRVVAILGATDEELAKVLGFHVNTIRAWAKVHLEFGKMLTTAKLEADSQVGVRLYRRALGYSYDDLDIRAVTKQGQFAGSEIVQTPITVHEQPDMGAIQYWLNNRQGHNWKSRTEATVEVVNMDLETAEVRFVSRMTAALEKAKETRSRRAALGMTGD